MAGVVYLNGRLMPADEARVSPLDRGLLYGYGLFETVRSYGGRVFRLDRHLARLMGGAETLALASGLDPAQLEQAMYRTVEANGLADARIRLTVTAGAGERSLGMPSPGSLTILVVAEPLHLPSRIYDEGISAAVVSVRRNSQSPVSSIKSLNYLDGLIARAEAETRGADEAVLLNERGYLAECSSSNIFLVSSGKLLTPSVASGILPGVTREAVLEVAAEVGIESVEGDVLPDELARADEVFITTSVREVVPVVAVDGRLAGSGKPGPVTGRLATAYRELVRREL
ncbi:MAG: aminotransferase class IV [Chloroflexota bacterium]|nr:aminotransferase class IV [Chloroflexota bacterium]